MGIDALITLGGLLIPPVFDFVKKLFIKPSKDNAESTMSSLAITSPEHLAGYVNAMGEYMNAQAIFFNRDVYGAIPIWVSGLRAVIRPAVVIVGLSHFALHGLFGDGFVLDIGTRYFYEINISSWFGTKMTKE
jgi:hypothetical protein